MDAHSSTYPHLFSEIGVGGRTVRNRIALPATLTNFGAGNRVTERWIDFLAERARGGCGLVVTEIIAVDPEALAHGAIVTGYDDANDAGFERVATRCTRPARASWASSGIRAASSSGIPPGPRPGSPTSPTR